MSSRTSLIVLSVALVIVTAVFGVRATYAPAAHYAIAGIQVVVVCFASWRAGASMIVAAGDGRRRELAIAASLLIMPVALFAILPGIGPPGVGQTSAEEQLRYVVLAIGSALIAGGWVMLREALSAVNERIYSTLGFAATTIAAPLYLVFMTLMIAVVRAKRLDDGTLPAWIASLAELADLFLFFGQILTYAATAAFAMSLHRVQWLRRASAGFFLVASLVAIVGLSLRGLAFPTPSVAFEHWYTTLGWVVGIPAVPWLMPCALGVILLRRAGEVLAGLNPQRN